MISIPGTLRQIVIQRTRNACEYCGLSQEGQEATFHIDHIIPRAAGGLTTSENLALACVSCSLHKSARQTAAASPTVVKKSFYFIHDVMPGLSISGGKASPWLG